MWILSGTGCLSHLSPLAEVDVEGGVELHHMILLPLIPDDDFFSKNRQQSKERTDNPNLGGTLTVNSCSCAAAIIEGS